MTIAAVIQPSHDIMLLDRRSSFFLALAFVMWMFGMLPHGLWASETPANA